MLCFFFFKQKTAYEMRISDWSSDVCSSDLLGLHNAEAADRHIELLALADVGHGGIQRRLHQPERAATEHQPLGVQAAHQHLDSVIDLTQQIGSASGRERVCQYVYISVVAVTLQQKKKKL